LAVSTEKNGDDLGVVEIALREERPKGTIDHSAGENLFFSGATFPAEVASRNATDGGCLFLVFDGEREEVLAIFDFRGGDSCDDDDCFAHGDESGAIGEFGEFTGFDAEVAIAHAGGHRFMVVAHSWMEESRQSMSQREESLGTGEESQRSAWVGFRGHSGGHGACVVSSAQLRLVREFPLGGTGSVGWWLGLFPQFQFFKKGAVPFRFGTVKIVEESATATDHGEEATAGGEVFDGVFEVGREVVDPFCQ